MNKPLHCYTTDWHGNPTACFASNVQRYPLR